MSKGQAVFKKKRDVFLAICLSCVTAAAFAGCTEGGGFDETDVSGQDGVILDSAGIVDEINTSVEDNAEVIFVPSEGYKADNGELDAAKDILEKRLDALGVSGYELKIDYSLGQIKLSGLNGGSADDTEEFFAGLCERAELTFREGALFDIGMGGEHQLLGNYEELPVLLDGSDVKEALAYYNPVDGEYFVNIQFNDKGTEKFDKATGRLCKDHGIISIYLDEKELCRPIVTAHITDGMATITGGFNVQSSQELADKINIGALPFNMEILG